MSAYKDWHKQYIEAGYSPIPIAPGEKRPGLVQGGVKLGLNGWQRFCDAPASDSDLRHWNQGNVEAGIGLALGYNNVVAIDIDVGPGEIFDGLKALLPDSDWVKKGAKGLTAFFRTEVPMKAQKFKLRMKDGKVATEDEGGEPAAVLEILSHGNQTVIPPTIHPGTGRAYRWGDEPLSACPALNLPILGAGFPDEVKAFLLPYGYEARSQNYRVGHWGTEHDGLFREVNDEALLKLDAWVPNLDRVEYKPKPNGGYHLTAVWRGGDNEEAIGVDHTGIRDFTGKSGNGGGLTAIDLVVLHNDLNPREAWSWLFDQLNPNWQEELARFNEDSIRHTERMNAEHQAAFEEQMRKINLIEAEERRKAAEEVQMSDHDLEMLTDRAKEIVEGRSRAIKSPEALDEIMDRATGLLADLVRAGKESSETPSTAVATTAALAVMSGLYGRRWAVNRDGGGKTFANIYVFGTAPSGIGKTSTFEALRRLYMAAVERAMTPSATALYERRMLDGIDEDVKSSEDFDLMSYVAPLHEVVAGTLYEKDVHAPATVHNRLLQRPNTVMVVDECSNFVRRVWSPKSGDSSIGLQGAIKKLISAANGVASGTDYTDSKRNQTDVHNPGFSLIGFSTPRALMNALPMAAYEDGTIGRFLWLDEPGFPDMQRAEPNDAHIADCIEKMASVISNRINDDHDITMGGYICPEIPISPAAVERSLGAGNLLWRAKLAYHEEARRATKSDRDDAALWSRVAEVAQRVALLHALGRGIENPVVTEDDMEFGLRLATYSITRWSSQADVAAGREVHGAVEHDTKRRRVIALIASEGGTMTRSKLGKKLKLSKQAVIELVEDLMESGIVILTPGVRADSQNVVLVDAE